MDPSFVTPPVPESPRPTGRLIGDALRRPGGRRALSVLSLVLALAGVGMFAYPFGTDLYSKRIQNRLRSQFDDVEYAQSYQLRKIKVGQGLTRLRIPKLDVEVLVVEGTTPAALKAGAGHYVGTPLPGEAGNVAIAGHRTTFGRPFNRMDELGQGDKVYLDTPFATFEYSVVPAFGGHDNPWATSPQDFSVVGKPSSPEAKTLTLTTCHPKGSARERLILRLTLTGTKIVKKPAA
ncbi:MAG TPA: class E sortase [Mycobacteriales bacterium]|nr:class E sortase [Mycobacteriales bacterium]